MTGQSSTSRSLVAAAVTLAFVVTACNSSNTGNASEPEEPLPTAVASESATHEGHSDHKEMKLPPNGKPLIAFLTKEIPALLAKVPCSCCPYKIAECFSGKCPPTCGPCNRIGRDAYHMHKLGMSDEAIVAQVRTKYNINR